MQAVALLESGRGVEVWARRGVKKPARGGLRIEGCRLQGQRSLAKDFFCDVSLVFRPVCRDKGDTHDLSNLGA